MSSFVNSRLFRGTLHVNLSDMSGPRELSAPFCLLPVSVDTEAEQVPIWGMTPRERLEKQAGKLGLDVIGENDPANLDKDSPVLIIRSDTVLESAILKALTTHSGSFCLIDQDSGQILGIWTKAEEAPGALERLKSPGADTGGVPCLTPGDVAGAYNPVLRKKQPPLASLLNPGNRRNLEWSLYRSAYKGVTDFVTKYIWPVPAFHVTRACAALGFTPNAVTIFGAVLMVLATWLFSLGAFGWGLAAGWVMVFLDTVDGKLARTTLTSSKWGEILDHGIDLLHPPFWYAAWAWGLGAGTLALGFNTIMILLFGFYIASRLLEGYFIQRFGMHMHVWRRWDSRFREFMARRNPNLALLTLFALAGQPSWGLYAVIIWQIVTFLLQLLQIAQAEYGRARGREIRSWLDSETAER